MKHKRCCDCSNLKGENKGPWVDQNGKSGHTMVYACPYMMQRLKALIDKELMPPECLKETL